MVFDFGVEHVINNYKSADMLMGSGDLWLIQNL